MRTGLHKTVFRSCCILLLLWTRFNEAIGVTKDKVEYIRLPLLTIDANKPSVPTLTTSLASFGNLSSSNLTLLEKNGEGRQNSFDNSSIGAAERSVNVDGESMVAIINQLTDFVLEEDDDYEDNVGDQDDGDEEEDKEFRGMTNNKNDDEREDVSNNDEDDNLEFDLGFTEQDLIDLVQELEQQADEEEQSGIFPELLDIVHGRVHSKKNGSNNAGIQATTTTDRSNTNDKESTFSERNGSARIYINEDGDLQLGSDLSEYSDEIVDGVSAGVEESLRMSDDLELEGEDDELTFANLSGTDNGTAETRQFSVYLFQGQYYAEPRLNRFIDGALRNMGTELRVASMDPLYFRVLPRGQVAEREQPLMVASGTQIRRRRPAVAGGVVGNPNSGISISIGRQLKLPAFFRPNMNRNNQKRRQQVLRQQSLKKPVQRKKVLGGQQVTRITSLGGRNIFLRRKQQQQRRNRQRRRRQRIRQQQQRLKNRRKKQNQKIKQQQNQRKKQQQALLNRIRRRTRQDVGGGRIEGLSRVQRDGDAEMQLFGNYTLIRSHMKYGPLEITMQFRTKNGIRRSGATLPVIRAHTVTRVNHEGSEMIDYLLDRPTPEMIRVRGTQFPMAQRIARNIFARLFLPNSFLSAKLREKAHLAYLSKPAVV